MARIIVVTSGKGGVGKTTTSAAFSSGLAFDPERGEGFIRINFGCPHSQTLEAVDRLAKALT